METSAPADRDAEPGGPRVPEFVDWIAAALVAASGLALAIGGSVLAFVVDRDLLEEGVDSGEITVLLVERELTRAEMLEFTSEVVSWTGIGLLVTGVALVAFAVWYVVARRRAHQRAAAGEPVGSYWRNAVLGAVVTSILSFVPFSPVLGGGVAGYLESATTGRSVVVGAFSGFLAALPALAVIASVAVGLFAGLAAVGATDLGIVTAAVMLFALVFAAVYGAGLGAVGGFAGDRVADHRSADEP